MEIRRTPPDFMRAIDEAATKAKVARSDGQTEAPDGHIDGIAGGGTWKLGDSPAARLGGAREVTASGSGLPTGETPASKAAENRAAGSGEGRVVNADHFAREARIRASLGGGPTAPEGRFGSKDGGSLTAEAGELPAPGLGKNRVSLDGQRSAEADAGANANGNPNADAGADANAKNWTPPPEWQNKHQYTILESLGMLWRGIVLSWQNRDNPETHNAVSSTRGTPDPTKEVGVRDAAFDLHRRPAVNDAIEARRRQVGQPGEGPSRERVHASHDVALKEGLRRPSDGRITPVDGDGTVGGQHTGTPQPNSGIEKVDGTRPGDPKRPGVGEE